ncbi:MAG: hypothetical protein QM695_09785 [Micropruina sp.]
MRDDFAIQMLAPYEPRYAAQRAAVSGFCRSLAAGTPSGAALLAADRSLALLRADGNELTRFVQLVERGEETAQLLPYIGLQVFGSCGQPWSMLFLVAWISSLMAGPPAATTRGSIPSSGACPLSRST